MKSLSEDKRPLCVLPVRAVKMKSLRGNDMAVLAALGYYANRAGVCWPSLQSLVQVAGIDEQTVLRAITRLEGYGLVRQLKPNDYDQKAGPWGMSNRYQVLWTENAPLPTWEEIREANPLQPIEDQLPVEGSGVRGPSADPGHQKRMIAAYEQGIEAVIGVRPPFVFGAEAIAAKLIEAQVEASAVVATAARLQRQAAADRRGIVPFHAVSEACINAIRSDGSCTPAADRPTAVDPADPAGPAATDRVPLRGKK